MYISLANGLYVANSDFVKSIFAEYKKWMYNCNNRHCRMLFSPFVGPSHTSQKGSKANKSPNMALYIHLCNWYSIGKLLLLFLTFNIIRIKPNFITLFQILCCSFPTIVTSADEPFWFSGDELCADTLGWITQSWLCNSTSHSCVVCSDKYCK